MEINLAWLVVLPVFFALGWIAARFDRGQHWKETQHISHDTLSAMSALLAGHLEKATDALLAAARSAPDATELHQAVGNLYRKRGMIDRAIEVHEAALRHPHMEPEERLALMLDLARDYVAAGLFDRAEAALSELIQSIDAGDKNESTTSMANEARLMLMESAQRIRDWDKAMRWAKEARKHGARFRGEPFEQLAGHFHCELAEEALQAHKPADAQRYLELAAGSGAAGPAARVAAIRAQMGAGHGSGAGEEGRLATAAPGAVTAQPAESACRICGFRSRKTYWQCPGCHHWDSFENVT
jgi:lipopolysaccharide biosynthesis regulator YciM